MDDEFNKLFENYIISKDFKHKNIEIAIVDNINKILDKNEVVRLTNSSGKSLNVLKDPLLIILNKETSIIESIHIEEQLGLYNLWTFVIEDDDETAKIFQTSKSLDKEELITEYNRLFKEMYNKIEGVEYITEEGSE